MTISKQLKVRQIIYYDATYYTTKITPYYNYLRRFKIKPDQNSHAATLQMFQCAETQFIRYYDKLTNLYFNRVDDTTKVSIPMLEIFEPVIAMLNNLNQ